MKKMQKRLSLTVIVTFTVLAAAAIMLRPNFDNRVSADNLEFGVPTPTP